MHHLAALVVASCLEAWLAEHTLGVHGMGLTAVSVAAISAQCLANEDSLSCMPPFAILAQHSGGAGPLLLYAWDLQQQASHANLHHNTGNRVGVVCCTHRVQSIVECSVKDAGPRQQLLLPAVTKPAESLRVTSRLCSSAQWLWRVSLRTKGMPASTCELCIKCACKALTNLCGQHIIVLRLLA